MLRFLHIALLVGGLFIQSAYAETGTLQPPQILIDVFRYVNFIAPDSSYQVDGNDWSIIKEPHQKWDCEDYTLTIASELQKEELSWKDMEVIATKRTVRGKTIDHRFLVVKVDKKWWVIDSYTKKGRREISLWVWGNSSEGHHSFYLDTRASNKKPARIRSRGEWMSVRLQQWVPLNLPSKN